MRVVVRADAAPHIGAGHLMRCAALVAGLRGRGADVAVLASGVSSRVARMLTDAGVLVASPSAIWPAPADLEATIALARHGEASSRWVVVDGYHFDDEFHQGLLAAGLRLLCIDDLNALDTFGADVVLNHALGAERTAYRTRDDARVLLGSTYALVPDDPAPRRPAGARPRRLLVTLGGADPAGLTIPIVEAIGATRLDGAEVQVIVGPANPRLAEIRRAAAPFAAMAVEHDPPAWREILSGADVAVTAAGGTLWELAVRGVPSVAVVAADNQTPGAAAMAEADAAEVVAGLPVDAAAVAAHVARLWEDADRRLSLATRARRLIDGRGVARVARWMTEAPDASAIPLRPAVADDVLQWWRIASDPVVRRQSFDPSPIPLATHFAWFDARLASPRSRLYAAVWGDELAGQIRYDIVDDGAVAELGFAVAQPFRGRGLGVRLLTETWRRAGTELGVGRVRGWVIEDNAASLAAFQKAGFIEVARAPRAGRVCAVFERQV